MQEQGFWLSPQQKFTWTIEQEVLRLSSRAVCLVALHGSLDVDRLRDSLRELVSRHEILRTVFRRQTGMKVPFQVVLESCDFGWQHEDLSTSAEQQLGSRVHELFQTERTSTESLETAPVLKARLLSVAADRFHLILSVPSLCADDCSLQILVNELGTIYARQQNRLGEPFRYVQFAQWQLDLLESDEEDARKAKDLWGKRQFTPIEVGLPSEKKSEQPFLPEVHSLHIGTDLSTKILNSNSSGVLVSGWEILLARLSGQTAFSIGLQADGREYEELENAVGCFARTLPIPAEIENTFSFSDVLGQTIQTVHDAVAVQEYFAPEVIGIHEDLVSYCYRDLGTKQTFDGVGFTLERIHVVSEPYKLRLVAVRRQSEQGQELEFEFHYDSSRFERSSVECMAGYYVNLLTAALANPATAIARLPLLSESERQQLLVEWNQTASEYPKAECLHQLFEQQAEKTPEQLAVRCGEQTFTYRALNQAANQLAHYLRKHGIGPDRPVGLCLDRSAETMMAVLAILKAGGAYVPLNADNPPARLKQQLEGAAALITEAKLAAQMPEFAGTTILLDRDQKQWANEPKKNPASNTNPESLVYVIYTSGSTGVPKGVAVRHRNLVNYAHCIAQKLELEKYPEGLQFATVSTLGADLGNTCIYPSLISGGCLHIVSYEMATDPHRMAEYVSKHPIDVLKIVPSHLQALLQSEEAGKLLPRKYLITGGETLTPKLVEKIASLNPQCEVINHYGPTETTVGSLTLKLKDYDWKNTKLSSIPIGRPIANTEVYVLDQKLEPVPVGVIGELYIAGAGVTAGYLGQAEKTAERFLKNPFSNDPSAKMYRTGDLARYGADGNLEFLGRGDDQVKIRGFRIELGEIESVLARHPAVKQVVVLAREDERGDKRLLAYVVPSRGQVAEVHGEDLRSYLKQQLPDYMVPQAVILLPKLPLTANGKIDRNALPQPEQAQTKHTIVAPRNEEEVIVLNIWRRVLGRDRISITDSFFELGGHSLMAVQLMAEIRKETGKEIPLAALFQGATIEHLANLLRGATDVDKSILRTIQEQGSQPPFFAAVLPGVNALGYLTLSKHMGSDQPFYMLQSPGPGPRAARRPYAAEEYEQVASDYIRAMRSVQPNGPYYVGGMCEGARIAFEMVRLLESQGHEVNLLAILDTWVIENTQNQRLWKVYYYSVRLRQFWRQPWHAKLAMAKTAASNRLQ